MLKANVAETPALECIKDARLIYIRTKGAATIQAVVLTTSTFEGWRMVIVGNPLDAHSHHWVKDEAWAS